MKEEGLKMIMSLVLTSGEEGEILEEEALKDKVEPIKVDSVGMSQ